MLKEKLATKIDEMNDTKEKRLLEIIKEKGKPFIQKCDGYACQVEEDTEIKFTDWENNECIIKAPKGSYITVDEDCHYPKIITSEDWEYKNKFIEGKKETPKEEKKGPSIGIEIAAGGHNSEY